MKKTEEVLSELEQAKLLLKWELEELATIKEAIAQGREGYSKKLLAGQEQQIEDAKRYVEQLLQQENPEGHGSKNL